MKKPIRKLALGAIERATRVFPLRFLQRAAGQSPISPFYHLVADEPPPHIRPLYSVRTIAQFSADLDFFLGRYSPIDLHQLRKHISHSVPLPPNAMFLSTDDGMREVGEIMAPICRQKGVPLTMFLNPEFLDNQTLFYRHKTSLLIEAASGASASSIAAALQILQKSGIAKEDLRRSLLAVRYPQRALLDELAPILNVDFSTFLSQRRPYLTSDEVSKLVADGVTIGGHSLDHPYYPDISLSQQLDQTIQSVQRVRQRFGIDYGVFAFPFGADDITLPFYDTLFQSGVVELVFAASPLVRPPRKGVLGRFWMEADAQASPSTLVRRSLHAIISGKISSAGWYGRRF